MNNTTLGVIRRSSKTGERRVPIHPAHLSQVPAAIRSRLIFERGYGDPFGVGDEDLAQAGVALASREEILRSAGVVLLAKPLESDLETLREGGVLWGWPHCVQQPAITQVAIDRRHTLICWESMFLWTEGGDRDLHLFYRNNEMAGYCGVLHALACAGLDGHYGEPLRAVVLSHGSVSRGAIGALRGIGVRAISVCTQRPTWTVHDQVMGCDFAQIESAGDALVVVDQAGDRRPLVDVLVEADVIVNGILQDPERPLMFLRENEIDRLKAGALIVDISCDEGMGFPFARPTSFAEPVFRAGRATYYAVDHTPSYLWRSASWELSRAVVPFLETVLGGPEAWQRNETIARAIEIRDGVVDNEQILRYQGREAEYPHRVL